MKKLLESIDEYGIDLTAPTEINVSMKKGMARLFADNGIRTYLENAVKIANRNMIKSLDNGESTRAIYFANRIETLILLLTTGKVWYNSNKELEEVKQKHEIK